MTASLNDIPSNENELSYVDKQRSKVKSGHPGGKTKDQASRYDADVFHELLLLDKQVRKKEIRIIIVLNKQFICRKEITCWPFPCPVFYFGMLVRITNTSQIRFNPHIGSKSRLSMTS